MKSEMIEDPRTIIGINDDEGGLNVASVGHKGVTKIECYGEPAEYCLIPYVRVWKGEHLWIRRKAIGLSIYYEDQPQ